jgi:probable phosphoglycerate mutase
VSTTIFFVRHVPHALQDGTQVGRRDGIPLADDAADYLNPLAERLAGEPVKAVYASPISRTQQTAKAIAERHDLPVHTEDDFQELDFAGWTGTSFDDLENDPEWRKWNAVRSLARAPGGETMVEVQSRMMRGVERVRRENPEGAAVVVSHGDPLKTVVLYLLGAPIDMYERLQIDPGSVTTAVVGDWGAKLIRLNEKP